jgi:hypothetical protein
VEHLGEELDDRWLVGVRLFEGEGETKGAVLEGGFGCKEEGRKRGDGRKGGRSVEVGAGEARIAGIGMIDHNEAVCEARSQPWWEEICKEDRRGARKPQASEAFPL